MNLYCRLPFGQQHMRNPEIVRLATAIGRTPGSVAMKLNNFTSLDPEERSRGVRGLSGTSRLDQAVWDEFHADWDSLSAESELLWSQRVETDVASPAHALLDESLTRAAPSEAHRFVRTPLTQRFFRQTVLASYNSRCCITTLSVPELLEAAHGAAQVSADEPAAQIDTSPSCSLNLRSDGIGLHYTVPAKHV